VPVWIAPEKLTPGSQDWEREIREALDESLAVLLLASPESAKSRYVRGEVTLAEAAGLTVVPAWVAGEQWPESVPLGMQHSQRLDIRGVPAWDAALKVADALAGIFRSAFPDYFRVQPAGQSATVPMGFVGVKIVDDDEVAMFRIEKFKCRGDFLDELFLRCVSESFSPYSYGREWFLVKFAALYLPFDWLKRPDGVFDGAHLEWLRQPMDVASGSWMFVERECPRVIGVAYNDVRCRQILRQPKRVMMLRRLDKLRSVALADINEQFRFVEVAVSAHVLWDDENGVEALVETDAQDEQIEYLLRDAS
jgi:hypothetical protein